jgi:hypothetical protein
MSGVDRARRCSSWRRTTDGRNPETLYRVFGAADWGNREMLPNEILKDLIEGLSEVSPGDTAVSSNILGDAYEYRIGRDQAGGLDLFHPRHWFSDIERGTTGRRLGDAMALHGMVRGFGIRRAEEDVSPAGVAEAHRIIGHGLKTLPGHRTKAPKLNHAVSDGDRHGRLLLRERLALGKDCLS